MSNIEFLVGILQITLSLYLFAGIHYLLTRKTFKESFYKAGVWVLYFYTAFLFLSALILISNSDKKGIALLIGLAFICSILLFAFIKERKKYTEILFGSKKPNSLEDILLNSEQNFTRLNEYEFLSQQQDWVEYNKNLIMKQIKIGKKKISKYHSIIDNLKLHFNCKTYKDEFDILNIVFGQYNKDWKLYGSNINNLANGTYIIVVRNKDLQYRFVQFKA